MKFTLRAILPAFILASTLFLNCSCSYARSADYESLHRFSQILDLVNEYYVKDVSQKELIEGAIKGMLESLDPHSTYMTTEEFSAMQETTSGEFVGIGAELTIDNGRPMVIAPIEGTPADRAGIKSGDVIVSVDGALTLDKSLTETVSKIRGEKGTTVELVILSKGENKPKTIKIIRDAIPYISVKSTELEKGYYWIRLAAFNERTTEELKEIIEKAQKTGGIKGIILDMRNNPGGILDQAASVSDLFLDEGVIVSIRGRDNKIKKQYEATKNKLDLLDIPIVTLINSGSASASEIVAGALSDHKRSILMGARSFGKGSVQNLIPLRDGAGIKLTIALYYTPSGKSIQAEGIEPNIDVPFLKDGEEIESVLTIRENDLDKHLDQGADTGKNTGKNEGKENKVQKFPNPELVPLPANLSAETKKTLTDDNQLRAAFQTLKNMPILK